MTKPFYYSYYFPVNQYKFDKNASKRVKLLIERILDK